MGSMSDIVNDSLFKPDPRLVKELEKKLTALGVDLLRIWLNEERAAASEKEWIRQMPRVQAADALCKCLVEFRGKFIRHTAFDISDDERAMLKRADEAISKAEAAEKPDT